jgi:dipeptidyl aminopeptidase/acylaminoacyl peptidase
MSNARSRRPLTVETLWRLRRAAPAAATPDGGIVVLPVSRPDLEANRVGSRLYRVGPDGGDPAPLTGDDASAGEPAISPDGTRVAYVRKERDGKPQLALLPLQGGEADVLTDLPLGVTDPRWFPDGRRIAFLAWLLAEAPTPEGTRELLARREADPVRAYVTEDRLYRFWDTWLTDGRVLHLVVLDLGTHALLDLTPGSRRRFDPMDPRGQYAISPDGEEIAFSADASSPPHDPTNWDVFTVSARGGEARNLTTDNPADDVRPRYSPDGRWILYGMQRLDDYYADRVRLALYDRKRGDHRVLTEDWDRSAAGWEFSPADGSVVLLAEHLGRTGLFRAGLAPGEPRLLRTGGTLEGLVPLADGSVLALENSLAAPSDLVRIAADGRSAVPLTALNRDVLSGVELGEVREITYPGAQGHPIQAWMILPPGFDPAGKWPLIEVLHGGPHGASPDQFHYRWNLQLFAAPGYVVLAPNFHGSTGWGEAFAMSIHGDWGTMPAEDALAGVDAVIGEGFIDPARIAAAGGSYGGYLVTWLAGHTDRFACLVNHAGVADTLGQYGCDVTRGRARAFGGEPWDGLERIDAVNPLRFASAFRTPMLVSHGERDYRVPVNQGTSVYNVLRAKGVPARLVVFPEENHWVLKPGNSRFWYEEVLGWLRRWIGAGPSPR